MKTIKVFSRGKIISPILYSDLKLLDYKVFAGCNDEFLSNRDWWVMISGNNIVGYCGCAFTKGICIFVRAWVHRDYRGQGLQKKMIKLRIKSAYDCHIAITYTTLDNYPSANSLISQGFKLYSPEYAYAGREMLYFQKELL
jgi:GNAT superfamily N-acetyltransferase